QELPALDPTDRFEHFEQSETVNDGGDGTGSLGLVSSAIGLGFWIAGGVLSYTLGSSGRASGRLSSANGAGEEARGFVEMFEKEYGDRRPNFVGEGFMEALQRSRREFKLMFVYLHSPEHPDTRVFCEETLCSELLSGFVNENFVAWGGSVRGTEGFKMSNSLKASRFPFCAVVMAATNQRIALLQQGQLLHFQESPSIMFDILFNQKPNFEHICDC
ncbi:hypothetical protein M8C21_020117, partial [Ambrosia artemisiifolia]